MKRQVILTAVLITLIFAACKDSSNTVNAPAAPVVVNPISNANPLSGYYKGTMTSGTTYHIRDTVKVKSGDTLTVQSGVTVIGDNLYSIVLIQSGGTFICNGTSSSPITFEANATNIAANGAIQGKGSWIGIECDSVKYAKVSFTNINHAVQAFKFVANAAQATGGYNASALDFSFTDNVIFNSSDDAVRIQGGRGEILRNTLYNCGTTDGDNINVKAGFKGDIAYNVVVDGAGNSIKINSTVVTTQTQVNIYNNTCVNSGQRRPVSVEVGYGILVDQGGRAAVFNNLIVTCAYGLKISNVSDSTWFAAGTHYGNSYFYRTFADSVLNADGTVSAPKPLSDSSWTYLNNGDGSNIASRRTNDIIGKNPLFNAYDQTGNWLTIAVPANNNFHLLSGSPAIGGAISFTTAITGDSRGTIVPAVSNYGAY
jgi:hypothetical protein